MSTPLLRHIHFRKHVPFSQISSIQARLVGLNLAHKASPTTTSKPSPYLITFTPEPVYTFGRRSPPSLLSPDEQSSLKKPLDQEYHNNRLTQNQSATLEPTLRGGLTTFHGPGQLVVYPIFDLKGPEIKKPIGGSPAKYPDGLDVRGYVHLLEQTTIDLLAKHKLKSFRTSDPGVWIAPNPKDIAAAATAETPIESELRQEHPEEETEYPPALVEAKIAALGVHLRRNITSCGTALNVAPDLRWFERIVPCGIKGKATTSLRQLGWLARGKDKVQDMLASQWARVFATKIWGQEAGFNGVLTIKAMSQLEELGGEDALFEILESLESPRTTGGILKLGGTGWQNKKTYRGAKGVDWHTYLQDRIVRPKSVRASS